MLVEALQIAIGVLGCVVGLYLLQTVNQVPVERRRVTKIAGVFACVIGIAHLVVAAINLS